MKCRQFERLVVLAEASELTARQRQSMHEHGEACPRCCEFARDMRTVQGLLKGAPAAPPPADFEKNVMERIRLARATGERQVRVES